MLLASLLLAWSLLNALLGESAQPMLPEQQPWSQWPRLLLTTAAASAAGTATECWEKQLSSAAVGLLLLVLLQARPSTSEVLLLANRRKSSTVSSRILSVERTSSRWLSPSHAKNMSSRVLQDSPRYALVSAHFMLQWLPISMAEAEGPIMCTQLKQHLTLQDCFAAAAKCH